VVADIISEGKYNDNYLVEDGREHLIKGDGFKTNLKGEHDEEKTVEKQPYEKPEKKDVVADINSEGKHSEDEVVEKQLYDAPRLGKGEIGAHDWKMKAEVCFVQGDGLDDAEDAIKINEEDMVRQDFALINWEDSKTEKTLPEATENVLKADAECQEAVIDKGCTSDLSGKAWWKKFKAGMSAENQAKVISTKGTKTYKFGASESVRSLGKVSFHAMWPATG
jgi:hypothetical protein